TGTGADGLVSAGNTCNDWTSTAGTTSALGTPTGGSSAWTTAPFAPQPCAGPFALYCFETAHNATVAASSTGRIAFVSKATLRPGPGASRATADAICQSEAQAAGL